MTAAETLAKRNDVMLCLRDVDGKLESLFGQKHSNRVYAECLELLDIRYELAYELVCMGGDPGVDPTMRWKSETKL